MKRSAGPAGDLQDQDTVKKGKVSTGSATQSQPQPLMNIIVETTPSFPDKRQSKNGGNKEAEKELESDKGGDQLLKLNLESTNGGNGANNGMMPSVHEDQVHQDFENGKALGDAQGNPLLKEGNFGKTAQFFDEEEYAGQIMAKMEKHRETHLEFQRKAFDCVEAYMHQLEEDRIHLEHTSFGLYAAKMQEISATLERIGKLEATLTHFLGSIQNVYHTTFSDNE